MGDMWSHEDVTPERLTKVLREKGVLGDAGVESVKGAPIPEQGQTSTVIRYELAYDGDAGDAPKTLVGKFPSPHAEAAEFAKMLGLYYKEARFYATLADDLGLPVPRCYYAVTDHAANKFCILFEDMSDSRCGTLFQSAPDDVEMVMGYLPTFHAKWWNDPQLRGHDFIAQTDDRPFYFGFIDSAQKGLAACKERFGKDVPETTERILGKFLGEFERFFSGYLQREPNVLGHSDFHIKQMFFPSESGGRFAVFDWQSPSIISPGTDPARLIACGLAPADQKAMGRRLVEEYHRGLLERGVEGYELDQAMLDFRVAVIWSMAINTAAAAVTDVRILEPFAQAQNMTWQEGLFGWPDACATTFESLDALEEALKM